MLVKFGIKYFSHINSAPPPPPPMLQIIVDADFFLAVFQVVKIHRFDSYSIYASTKKYWALSSVVTRKDNQAVFMGEKCYVGTYIIFSHLF